MIILRRKLFLNQNSNLPQPNPSSVLVAPKGQQGFKKPNNTGKVNNPQQQTKQQVSLQKATLSNQSEQLRTQRSVLESQDNAKRMALRKQEITQRRERAMRDNAIQIRKIELKAAQKQKINM